MIKDYLQQLKQIQQDKVAFESKSHKKQLIKTLTKQEDKYQAYIIDQMSTQNRIIAAHHTSRILQKTVRIWQLDFFKKILHSTKDQICSAQLITDQRDKPQSKATINSCESVSVDLVLLKLSLNSVSRAVSKKNYEQKREGLKNIIEFVKRIKIIAKMITIANRFGLKTGVQAIKTVVRVESRQQQLFTDSFSMIEIQKGVKKGNPDQSYLSFMLEKQNANSDCLACKQNFQLSLQREKQMSKMKEELSFLKHLLTEKTLELKMKQDQIDTLRQKSSEDSDQSGYVSKNSSYYSQIEKHVLGGKRERKCGSIASNSSQPKQETTSKQLLGKYMRQSFQLKETMDVAREMCLDLQDNVPQNLRVRLQKIANVLNQGEQISLVDEY